MEDLAGYAAAGPDEIVVDLQSTQGDAQELKDVAAEVHEKARAAGI